MEMGGLDFNVGVGVVFGEGVFVFDVLCVVNINFVIGFVMDYFNYFNEVVMLMEMFLDMCDCVEDVLEWKFVSYIEYFEMFVFKDCDFVVIVYEVVLWVV